MARGRRLIPLAARSVALVPFLVATPLLVDSCGSSPTSSAPGPTSRPGTRAVSTTSPPVTPARTPTAPGSLAPRAVPIVVGDTLAQAGTVLRRADLVLRHPPGMGADVEVGSQDPLVGTVVAAGATVEVYPTGR